MTTLLMEGFAVYIVACVIAASSICAPLRAWIKPRSPWLHIEGYPHFIECRLCISAWVSIAIVFIYSSAWQDILPVYGISYFLARMEH